MALGRGSARYGERCPGKLRDFTPSRSTGRPAVCLAESGGIHRSRAYTWPARPGYRASGSRRWSFCGGPTRPARCAFSRSPRPLASKASGSVSTPFSNSPRTDGASMIVKCGRAMAAPPVCAETNLGSFFHTFNLTAGCPLRVISRHTDKSAPCPLYPNKEGTLNGTSKSAFGCRL